MNCYTAPLLENEMAELTVSGKMVLVDDEDVDRLSALSWWLTPQGYAVAKLPAVNGHRRTIGMHRFLLDDPPTAAVDHINRNKRDNRKANLRACTDSENCRNQGKRRGCSSRYRGVSWNKRKSAWQVVVRENGRLKWKGWYASEAEAARIAAPHFAGIAP